MIASCGISKTKPSDEGHPSIRGGLHEGFSYWLFDTTRAFSGPDDCSAGQWTWTMLPPSKCCPCCLLGVIVVLWRMIGLFVLAHFLCRSSASFCFRWIKWYAPRTNLAIYVARVRIVYCKPTMLWRGGEPSLVVNLTVVEKICCTTKRTRYARGQRLRKPIKWRFRKETRAWSRFWVTQIATLRLLERWEMTV